MDPRHENLLFDSRRYFLSRSAAGIGTVALASLLNSEGRAATPVGADSGGVLASPHRVPKAKRVIYISMNGAPSQFETFDYKPELEN